MTDLRPGNWPSVITADMVVAAGVGIGGPQLAAGNVWWSETRPHEAGRVQLVRRPVAPTAGELANTVATDVLPDGFSARARIHTYGGGAWLATDDAVVFTEASDQRLWRLPLGPGGQPTGDPIALTPDGDGACHADPRPLGDGGWWVCVREPVDPDGGGTGPDQLVAVATDPAAGHLPVVLHTGADFMACPRVSPDGRWLCWLQWDLPHMPWETTSLWVAAISHDADGAPALDRPERVLGGTGVSLAQPGWFPDGRLAVVSDEDNWWNLWVFDEPGRPTPDSARQLSVVAGELAPPQWVLGQSTWGVSATGQVVGVWRADGHDHIGVIDAGGDEVHWVHSGHLGADGVAVSGSTVALIAGSFTVAPHVVVDQVDAVLDAARAGVHIPLVVHRPPDDPGVDATWLVEPEAVTVRSPDGVRVHALVYPPRKPDVGGPDVGGPDTGGPGRTGDLPPLLVLIHSGPTSAARPALAMGVQFWTSRGWMVAEVNYRGSTGYGRRYRNQLHHAWGVADVDDCIGVARWLADEGRVDPSRMVIRGGSAGGFTALGCLAAGDAFAAAAVRYPVTDLAALAAETHRFEAGYNDWLVADPDGQAQAYTERSPVHHVADINVPVLVLQGADDVVVPAGQTAAFVDALRQQGVAVTHEVFEGEGHGFRHADTLRRALAAEVAFFGGLSGGTSAP